MIVQPSTGRGEFAQSFAKVTRVSLVDLLNSTGGNAQDRQALASALRGNTTMAARVLGTRADGVSVLELAATRVALRLNGTPQPGEQILISLEDASGSGVQAPETSRAGATPTTHGDLKTYLNQSVKDISASLPASPAGALTKPPAPAAGVILSRAALLINDIQNASVNQTLIENTGIAPISEKAASAQTLAHALQQTVRSSGLFYESHLRGWVDGRVALAQLFEEPQAKVTEPGFVAAANVQDAAAAPAPSQPLRADTPVHPQLEPLVRQQLETLEQQSIVWRGNLWPGQLAELVISGEPQAADADPQTRVWRVRLALDSAVLGQVKADIALAGRALNLRLQGADAAAPILRAGRAALTRALSAHALEVQPIHVEAAAS